MSIYRQIGMRLPKELKGKLSGHQEDRLREELHYEMSRACPGYNDDITYDLGGPIRYDLNNDSFSLTNEFHGRLWHMQRVGQRIVNGYLREVRKKEKDEEERRKREEEKEERERQQRRRRGEDVKEKPEYVHNGGGEESCIAGLIEGIAMIIAVAISIFICIFILIPLILLILRLALEAFYYIFIKS